MTRPRLILAIRCAVLAGACAWLYPYGLWWLPIALMMPAFTSGGCGGPCTTGTLCANGQDSESIALTIAGLTDLACASCNDYNKTYNVQSGSTNCGYIATNPTQVPGSCGSSSFANNLTTFFQDDGSGNTRVRASLFLYDGGAPDSYIWDFTALGASPANCCITTITKVGSTSVTVGSTTQQCDPTAATVTIVGSDF